MRIYHLTLLVAAALTSATAAQDEPNEPIDNDFTLMPGQKLVPHDPNNSDPQYPVEIYEQLLPQFLDEEMRRKQADYADNERIVLLGAILTAEDDGNVKKANLLRRIKAWKDQSNQLSRRSLDDNGQVSSNGPDTSEPDAEDIAWVDKFMAGQPVDVNLLWSMPDFTNVSTDHTVTYVPGESENVFISALARAHTHHAIAHARHRARAAADLTAVFDQADADWATAFLNGECIDENLIFNSTDLITPTVVVPAPVASNATSAANSTLDKRDHAPSNAQQVIGPARRALRRARHRARRRARHHVHQQAHHHKHHHAHHDPHHHAHHKAHHKPFWGSHRMSHGSGSNSGHIAKHGIPKHSLYHHKKHCYRFNSYFMCPVICKQQWWGYGQNPQCLHLVSGGHYQI